MATSKRKGPVTIGGFAVDCVYSEEHTLESDVTDNPVEEGSDITDNVRNKAPRLSLDCIVSDTPLEAIRLLRDEGVIPSDAAWEHMKKLRADREPFVVVTPRERYENMLVEQLGLPIAAEDGKSIHFRLALKDARIVSNNRATTKVATPRSKSKKRRGPKAVQAIISQPIKGDVVAASGYSTGFGQVTDGLGATDGPLTNLTGDVPTPATDEDYAADAAHKWGNWEGPR